MAKGRADSPLLKAPPRPIRTRGGMDPGLVLGEAKVDPEAGGCQVPSKELRPKREVDMGLYWLEEHFRDY